MSRGAWWIVAAVTVALVAALAVLASRALVSADVAPVSARGSAH